MNNDIQESYCSFEVSKLLKDKGFGENNITDDLIKVQKLITKTKRLCKTLKI